MGESGRYMAKQAAADLKARRPASAVDRSNAMPLYHQIYLGLRDKIVRGDLAFGAAVPTEHELGAFHGVSRITARRALLELAMAGLVERRRRTGTRVAFRATIKPIEANIDQAVESLIAFGQDTQVRVLETSRRTADPIIATRFGIGPEQTLVHAVRLRMRERVPLGRITSYVRGDLPIDTSPEALTAKPMLTILREGGVTIGRAVQTVAAEVADADLAAMLAVEPRAPILRVERMVEDAEQRPVLLTIAQYRADRYRLTLDLHEHNRLAPAYA